MNDYLKSIIERYNADREDPTLTSSEKKILKRVESIEKEIVDVLNQIETSNKKLNEEQQKIINLNQELTHKRGQSKGLLDALLSMEN